MHQEEVHGKTSAREHEQTARGTVLLVEDDSLTIELIRTILRDRYDVLTAVSSAEAWDILRVRGVDVILMDISIKGDKSGLELTREIRLSRAHAAIPIIVLTAHAFEEDRVRSLAAGCDLYVRKPVKGAELRAIIEEQISRKRRS